MILHLLAVAGLVALAEPTFSPAYFWMWNDRLEETKLVAQLEDMHAHGLRSVCVHPFPKDFRPGIFETHMSPDYLTPEYLAVFVVGDSVELPRKPASGAVIRELKDGWTARRIASHEATENDLVVRAIDEKPRAVTLGDARRVFGESFSGKIVYRVEFESDAARAAVLDLGQVCWCAGARLNGKEIGSRFFGPFRWNVMLAKGRNVLEVTVANLLSTHLGEPSIRRRIAKAYKPLPLYERHQGRPTAGTARRGSSARFGFVSKLNE